MPKVLVDLDKLRSLIRAAEDVVPGTEWFPDEEEMKDLIDKRRAVINDVQTNTGIDLEEE